MFRAKLLAALLAALAASVLNAEVVKVSECVRNADLDVWAAPDVLFARAIMAGVFEEAGVQPKAVHFDENQLFDVAEAEVICSAFRTPQLIGKYSFPLQPLGQMHFALYTTPERAKHMKRVKITNWPSMRVAYSPVSQGNTDDRVRFFSHANLSPDYIEFPTSELAVDAVIRGTADVLFLYTPFGKRPENLVEIVPIGDRNIYFAVRKDRPELLKRLSSAYRKRYITKINKYDDLRESLLGIPKPTKRVRMAAYCRGDFFDVAPTGERTGIVEEWMKAISGVAGWQLDYVYGGYDESVESVKNGELDIIGGIGFAPIHRDELLYPHTPIGMLKVYLWAKPGSRYRPGDPESWHGMRVGLLAGTQSAERVKQQLEEHKEYGITYKEYFLDSELEAAYSTGEVDACVDVEKPSLGNSIALHIYASHPMYICTALNRKELFNELETTLDSMCDDFPRYMQMISERHYGFRNSQADLSLVEAEWLRERLATNNTLYVDLSPWPFDICNSAGEITGFPGMLFREISRRTGLKFKPLTQKEIQTAEAQFLRGETTFWVPYPAKPSYLMNGTISVFALTVPHDYAKMVGDENALHREFDLLAAPGTPQELVNIIRKTVASIDTETVQSMFMKAVADHELIHRVFGLTAEELTRVLVAIGVSVLCIIFLYGIIMMRLYRRQARRAQIAAADAERHASAKTRFLAAMSHELRTPLNAVIGFAEFLSSEGPNSEKRPEYVDGILTSANALLELINDVLDFSKLEAGALDMRADTCDVEHLISDLKTIFGYRVQKHGVSLITHRSDDNVIPPLKFSRQGLRQILINLVGNAAKFTLKGHIAVVYCWDEATGLLKIHISDTGAGISDSKMDKLFDPFVQDIASRMGDAQTGTKGTGLGLPIVKRLIDQAGGTIKAQSKLGRGTTFKIEIPNVEKATEADFAAAKAAKDACSSNSQLEGPFEKVLVVDDTPINRKVLGIHLEKLGIKHIRYAENGVAALEVMKTWKPDIVLTDMWMPDMDGGQLAFIMSESRDLSDIPVVAVTADVDVGSSYDMSGFVKIISKPVTREKLTEIFKEG